MSVIVERPYKFVPPHRGTLWPSLIQRFRLVDIYLRYKEGVVSYECRNKHLLIDSIRAGHGILLAPNHCRYADPLAMGWLSREVGQHVFAMASWHLFNKGAFDRFAIPKMGGFSIFREGPDRQSLETAIETMVQAERALVVFPEGTTNRTNDHLQPLMDGVPFMARTAAKRRAKEGKGPVVIHPVGIKYLFGGDIHHWADQGLAELETKLSWNVRRDLPILTRIKRVFDGLLSLKELQYLGQARSGDLTQRRDFLVESILSSIEQEFLGSSDCSHTLQRVRACRTKLLTLLLKSLDQPAIRNRMRRKIVAVDTAQQLFCYPDYYLRERVTDTRVLETIERLHEDFLGRPKLPAPLHAVIEVGEPIEVTDQRVPRGEADPVQAQMRDRLLALLDKLAAEARPFAESDDYCDSSELSLSSAESKNLLSSADATVSAITESRISL